MCSERKSVSYLAIGMTVLSLSVGLDAGTALGGSLYGKIDKLETRCLEGKADACRDLLAIARTDSIAAVRT